MIAAQLAHNAVLYFRRRGYPYLAVTVVEDGDFPSVQLWQDHAEIMWIIVYFDDPAREAEAVAYANELAVQQEYGAVAYAASSNCVIRVEDLQTRRW